MNHYARTTYLLETLTYMKKYFFENITIQFSPFSQRYTYWVLQTIQMKLILLNVVAEGVLLESAKTALEFKYEI